MKFLIQRTSNASVSINKECIGKIGKGYLVLIGISNEDNKETADKMINKMIKLRIFEDQNGKTNLSLADVKGELLLVSQFTLYADTKHGNRPGFTTAGKPEYAEPLYNYIVEECRNLVPVVEKGCFGADMEITLTNDGPFTIILDSSDLSL